MDFSCFCSAVASSKICQNLAGSKTVRGFARNAAAVGMLMAQRSLSESHARDGSHGRVAGLRQCSAGTQRPVLPSWRQVAGKAKAQAMKRSQNSGGRQR